MEKSRKIILSVCAVLTLCGINASAYAISIDTEATTIGHRYVGGYTLDFLVGQSNNAAAIPSFSNSLSDTKNFEFKISAPQGSHFEVHTNSGGTLILGLAMLYIGNGYVGFPTDYLPTTVSFDGYSGPTWYIDSSAVNVDPTRKTLQVTGSLWWNSGSTLSFDSLKITADLSQLSAEKLQSYTYNPYNGGDAGVYFQYVFPAKAADPGPRVFLTSSVPEPQSVNLFLCSIPIFLYTVRRRKIYISTQRVFTSARG